MKTYTVAVVGATGAVGREMLQVLEQRAFPVGRLVPLASSRSAGTPLTFRGQELLAQELRPESFDGVDIALFSAGAAVSRTFAPEATRAGARVIDNTSAFRMDDDVPLVVPEVNPDAALEAPRGIIANPNCSTIQLVVALQPIRHAAGLRRVVVSTYQAVSGAGQRGVDELTVQARHWTRGEEPPPPDVFPHPILFECQPHIGRFIEGGHTTEEEKVVNETRKIFGEPELRVAATAVRVPVLTGHSEAVNVETERPLTAGEARDILELSHDVELVDNPASARYPLARRAAGTDPVYVGRVREDPSAHNGLALWVVSDNLRKGAALNAVQIAECLQQRGAL